MHHHRCDSILWNQAAGVLADSVSTDKSLKRQFGARRTPVSALELKVPILYIFSGLPGSGKSTLAQLVARQLEAVYLRIDTIEQELRDFCSVDVQGEGYRLAYRIASENLHLGLNVVADSCNPIELTRREWEQTAREAQAYHRNIEVVCSDAREHRLRLETRIAEVSGLKLPTWSEVENREYDEWTVDRVIVDTAGRSETECASDLLSQLSRLPA
jgi:predicted kinase